MEITFDTTSMESLNACSEKIKAEIERIEKESRVAREKGTGKTKLVQKTSKKQKDILEEYVETYEGLLHVQKSVASFKGALTRRQKREQELEQIREDEQIFAEALVAENQYAAAQKLLEEERETIHEAYDAYQENKTDLNEQRLEESRVRIQTAFANVERAKAEAERTFARLDQRFPNIHLSEANVHDAKAAYHEYQAEQARKAAGEQVTPVLDQQEDAHIAEIREQQRKASEADLVRVLRARQEQLANDSRRSTIAADQKVTAARETANVAVDRAEKAAQAAHEAEIKLQQGIAAGRDTAKVMAARANAEGATEEDVARAIQAETEAHRLEVGLAQKEVAAKDVSKVADMHVVTATQAAHDAEVARTQTKAAANDTARVIKHRGSQYGLTGDQIVQNLPIRSNLTETYKTPGMVEEDIEASKKKIDEVPVADTTPDTKTIEAAKEKMDNFFEGNATPTITWVEMRDRINNLMLKKETDNKNLNPDDIYALYFLRKHPEAAPSKDTLNELLIWAGIVPLERTTPRMTGPAPLQLTDGKEVVSTDKKEEHEMTDEEIERAKHDLDHDKKDVEGMIHAIDGDTPKEHEMTDEEIEKAHDEINKGKKEEAEEKPAEPEKKPEGEKKPEEPEKESECEKKPEEPEKEPEGEKKPEEKDKKKEEKKAKRVKNRGKFMSRIKAKFKLIAVLMYGERYEKKSKGYQDSVEALCDIYSTYKTNSKKENEEALDKLNEFAKKNITDYKETQSFYKKLVKLAKKVRKYSEKHPEGSKEAAEEEAENVR